MVDVRPWDSEVEAGGKRIDPPASRRAWSLLAWLALHPGEHPRSAVAAAFWPDVLDSSPRLAAQRRVGAARGRSAPPPDGALTGGRDRIGLACETDLAAFEAPVAAWRARGRRRALSRTAAGGPRRGLGPRGARRARAPVAAVLARLADQAATRRRPRVRAPPARAGPARRSGGADLMQRPPRRATAPAALAVGERLRERLRTQLGIAISPQTRALEAQLRTGGGRRARPRKRRRSPVGRDAELAPPGAPRGLAHRGRPAASCSRWRGEGGIGKTRWPPSCWPMRPARAAARRRARRWSSAALRRSASGPSCCATSRPQWRRCRGDAQWPEDLAALVPSLPARARARREPAAGAGRSGAPARAPVRGRGRRRSSTRRPTARSRCCFEDVHLADRHSLELLTYVARRLAGARVLIVVTRRHAPAQPALDAFLVAQRARAALVEVELEPLSRVAIGGRWFARSRR